MIKDNQKVFNRLHLVMDALIVIISYVLAWVLHFKVFNHFGPEAGVLSLEHYLRALFSLCRVIFCCITSAMCMSPSGRPG